MWSGVVMEVSVRSASGVGGVAHGGEVVFGERAAGGMESGVGEVDAADGAEGQVEEDGEESVTGAAGQGHGLRDCTGVGSARFRGIAQFCYALRKVKIPTLSRSARQGWGTHFISTSSLTVG